MCNTMISFNWLAADGIFGLGIIDDRYIKPVKIEKYGNLSLI